MAEMENFETVTAAGEGRPARPAFPPAAGRDLEAVYDIPVQVSAVLGRATMQVSQLLRLGRGAVVELDRRSEEHTSELQSRQYLVCRLLLEKKNTHKKLDNKR